MTRNPPGVIRPEVVLLDRDGTIVVDKPYLADPNGLEFLPNAAAGLRRLTELGLRIVVVTNQSGIARGHFAADTVHRIHERLESMVAATGGRIAAIYFCPHHPDDGCGCRKPNVGLLTRAAEELRFTLNDAFVVGDQAVDVAAGQRCGATTLLVRTGCDTRNAEDLGVMADYVVSDLVEAAEVIVHVLSSRTRRGLGSAGRS